MKKYLIGAGGHASVISDIAKKQGILLNGVFIDENAKNITNLELIDSIKNIENYINDEFLLAFGNLNIRQSLEKDLSLKNIKWFSLIDCNAIICEDVKIGIGTVVMPGAIINAGAVIGNHVIINTGVIVEHGCIIEDHVHISPRSVICGNSKVGFGTWVGAGSTIINEISIGNNAIIGAGSVVVRDVLDNEEVMGVPAHKKIKIK